MYLFLSSSEVYGLLSFKQLFYPFSEKYRCRELLLAFSQFFCWVDSLYVYRSLVIRSATKAVIVLSVYVQKYKEPNENLLWRNRERKRMYSKYQRPTLAAAVAAEYDELRLSRLQLNPKILGSLRYVHLTWTTLKIYLLEGVRQVSDIYSIVFGGDCIWQKKIVPLWVCV